MRLGLKIAMVIVLVLAILIPLAMIRGTIAERSQYRQQAVDEVIRANRRIPHARAAMHRVRAMSQPVTLEEMMGITEVWVDTAMQLGEKPLRTMERLVRAQYKRHAEPNAATA